PHQRHLAVADIRVQLRSGRPSDLRRRFTARRESNMDKKSSGSSKKLNVTREVVRLLKNGTGLRAGDGTATHVPPTTNSVSVDPVSVISHQFSSPSFSGLSV